MNKKLNFIYAQAFIFLFFIASNLQAMNVIEKENEILIESKDKYPIKIFNATDFIDEMHNINSLCQKPAIALDLSNDASLNSLDVDTIISYLNRRNIQINFLDLSSTDIDESILDNYDPLISNKDFRYLDISDTHPADNVEGLSEKPKIIFIKKRILGEKRRKLKKAFGKEVIKRHEAYYEEREF